MKYTVLFKSVFGSHLYGTNVETSDRDYKQIHMCNVADIILGKDQMNITKQTSTKGKNTKDDVDFESKELRQFISDCLGGQTYAMDLLFTPRSLYLETSPIWEDILKLRTKLVTKHMGPFMGYVRSQAFKYSKKGSTLSELESIIALLKTESPSKKVKDVVTLDTKFGESVYVETRFNKSTNMDEDYLVVGSSSYPTTRQIADVLPSVVLKHSGYGERAKKAQAADGADLKAYYHAFRICWELEEILTTGEISFPSKKVDFLLSVRNGVYKRSFIEDSLISEIERVELIENNLPEPDYDFWNKWIINQYLGCDY